jgi:hypothetical protein
MQNVPKIVLNRLQEPAQEPHPDADLLTAFTEQSLPEPERAEVLHHLARCGDCRKVVALALPATEAVAATAASSPGRIGWRRWPALRWGVVAAGILAVASVGVLQYRQRQQEKALVSTLMHHDQLADAAVQNPAPPAHLAVIPQAKSSQQDEMRNLQAVVAMNENVAAAGGRLRQTRPTGHSGFPAGAAAGVPAGVGFGSGAGRSASSARISSSGQGFFSASNSAPSAAAKQSAVPGSAPQATTPSAAETVEVQAEAAQFATTVQNQAQNQARGNQAQEQLAQNTIELPLQGRNTTNLDVVKSKDPVPAQAEPSSEGAAPSIAVKTSPAVMAQSLPRWTISSAGELQRSFDAGKTWEDVSVAAASQPDSLQAQNGAVGGDKNSPTQKTQPKANVIFRAVVAIGIEAWAGGSGGVLYHTVDGGNRWDLLVPRDSVTKLTGDIIRIQLSDTQHAEVATSTGELWITRDGGVTWSRLQ